MSLKRLCIIPCGSSKIWDNKPQAEPTQAQFVYTGLFTSTCQRYAKAFFKDWVILSAKYGFLFPNDVVEGPYDISFNTLSEGTIKIEHLIEQAQLKGLNEFEEVVVLGGKNYIDRASAVFTNGQKVVAPLSGSKGIGYILQKLSIALEKGDEIGVDFAQAKRSTGVFASDVPDPLKKIGELSHIAGNGKYGTLYDYLRRQIAQEVTLTFKEVEQILGFPLPGSALQHRPWWANTLSHSQAGSWMNAGWQVIRVNMPVSVSFSKAN